MVLAFDTTAILVAVLTGSALGAVLGYLGLRYTASGRVRTTNADTLWEQIERRGDALERDIVRIRRNAVEVEAKAARAAAAALRVKRQLAALRIENDQLRAENARLRTRGGS
jgi:hypothetical protein